MLIEPRAVCLVSSAPGRVVRSGKPVFGEASDLGSYDMHAELCEEAIRGMGGLKITATGAQKRRSGKFLDVARFEENKVLGEHASRLKDHQQTPTRRVRWSRHSNPAIFRESSGQKKHLSNLLGDVCSLLDGLLA